MNVRCIDMVNTGKRIITDASFSIIAPKIVLIKEKKGLGELDISRNPDGGINIYASIADINLIRAELIKQGFSVTIDIDAPERVPEIIDPPTQDDIKSAEELKQAKRNAMKKEEDRLWQLIEDEYNLIKTTDKPFRRFTDIKYLRGQ